MVVGEVSSLRSFSSSGNSSYRDHRKKRKKKKKEREVAEVEGPALTCAETKGAPDQIWAVDSAPLGRSTCLVRDFVISCRFF